VNGHKKAHRIPMIDGDEMDALTRWHKYLHWEPGERKRIKRQYNRRQRRALKERTQHELDRALADTMLDLDVLNHSAARQAETSRWFWSPYSDYYLLYDWPTEGDGWRWSCGRCDVNSPMIRRMCGDWRYKW